jgi:hypothetical protein
MNLDLGFRGHVSITSGQINDISCKTSLGEQVMYGARGKSYNKKTYEIPSIKIGAIKFSSLILQEDSLECRNDATFHENKTKILPSHEPGRVGWELFVNTCLFIDAHNSKIAFCDSFETFKKKERGIDTFVKAPLLLERGLVEFDCLTPKGSVRCVLDTGSTWNVLNEGNEEISEQALWLPDNIVQYPFFQIEGSDFGPIAFHRMSIRIPIRIEAILGMEFIKNHRIFLDFANKSIYFSSNHWVKSKIRTPAINHSKSQQSKILQNINTSAISN